MCNIRNREGAHMRGEIEAEILQRRNVTIPAKDWEAFLRWAQRPPEVISGLKELASKPLSWEK
jgi:hypothetical protein